MPSKTKHTAEDEFFLVIRLVSRLRQLIHIYSITYYHLGWSDTTDARWDEWSNRLVELQTQFPWVKHEGYLPEWFYDWTGTTGMHLPANGWAWEQALDLIQDKEL